jgi:hypothetical protein
MHFEQFSNNNGVYLIPLENSFALTKNVNDATQDEKTLNIPNLMNYLAQIAVLKTYDDKVRV